MLSRIRNRKYNKSRKQRKTSRTRRTRRKQRKQRGGAGCGGEFALVQGMKIADSSSVNSSFTGLNIPDAMAKIYDPKCSAVPTDVPGPVYKM